MKFSIKYVLIFGLIGLLFISVSFALISSYKTSQRAMLQHSKEIMENISTFAIEKSRNYLFFARDAARLTSSLADTNIVSRKNRKQMEDYFYNQLCVYPQFSGIYYGDLDGSFIMVSRSELDGKKLLRTKFIDTRGERKVEFVWKDKERKVIKITTDPNDNYDPRKRPWFIKAVKEKKLIWTSPYVFYSSQKPGITTSMPVYSDKGVLQGVVGVDVEIDEISEFLSNLKIGKHGRAFILNSNGDVIAYPDKKLITNNSKDKSALRLTKIVEIKSPLTRAAFNSLGISYKNIHFDRPVFTKFTYNDKNYHAMFAPFVNEYWNWSIGIYMPENDYLGVIKSTAKKSIFIFAGVIFLYGIIAFIVGRSIERPLSKLEKEAVAVVSGKDDVNLSVSTIYKEIQNMADSFLDMKEKLKNKNIELEKINLKLRDEISEKEATEKLLKKSLKEKEVLLKEIHHRVKNNLQVISSLLNLQKQYQSNAEVSEILSKSQNRIYSMASVHNYLFKANDLSEICLDDYVEDLVEHIIKSFDSGDKNISLNIEANDICVPIDVAITIGLIINESVTNSLKYAFNGKNQGLIHISIMEKDKYLVLKIIDDGVGFNDSFDINTTKTLGMKLIKSMAAQFKGEIDIDSKPGRTEICIKLLLESVHTS
jgi:two-component sensor histidine kinase